MVQTVKFSCPSCGGITIWRCEKCRLFGREYHCPKCGFTGPGSADKIGLLEFFQR